MIIKFLKLCVGSYVFITVFNNFFISINYLKEIKQMSPIFNPFLGKKDYLTKDILVTNCLSVKFLKNYNKNKFIILKDPFQSNKKIIRFLVGLPGDWVRERNSQMYHKIPEGYCWVESFTGEDDSNQWGPISSINIEGYPIFIIWPINRFRTIKSMEQMFTSMTNLEERVLCSQKINEKFAI